MRTVDVCPSDFALERLLLAELPPDAVDVAAHVDGCAACRAELDAKRAAGDEFMRSPSAEALRQTLAVRARRAAEGSSHGPRNAAARPASLRRSTFATFAALAVAAAIASSFAVWHRRAPSAVGATDDETVVLKVQREWMEAIRDKDAAALERILADGYTYTDARGTVSNKADSLRQARSTGGHMTSLEASDQKAHIFGDTAIVTGRLRMEGVAAGESYHAEVRFTDILARIDGEWRAVAAHASKP